MKEKLIDVFDKEYSNDTLVDFRIKTEKMYELFGYGFKLNEKVITKNKIEQHKVWLNEQYKNTICSDLEIVLFQNAYASIISKIVETNLDNFNVVFSKLLDFYYENKNTPTKKYINMVYGCLKNPNSDIYSINIHLIPKILIDINNKILLEFTDNVVCINCDTIIFRNFQDIRERFELYLKHINKYDLKYYYNKSNFCFFLNKKTYIIDDNNIIKTKGIKHFDSDGLHDNGYFRFKINK